MSRLGPVSSPTKHPDSTTGQTVGRVAEHCIVDIHTASDAESHEAVVLLLVAVGRRHVVVRHPPGVRHLRERTPRLADTQVHADPLVIASRWVVLVDQAFDSRAIREAN